jgi:hypothetical protein
VSEDHTHSEEVTRAFNKFAKSATFRHADIWSPAAKAIYAAGFRDGASHMYHAMMKLSGITTDLRQIENQIRHLAEFVEKEPDDA